MTAKEPWSDEQTAELRRLLGVRLDYKIAAEALNAKFGTNRSRKSCSSHIYELGGRGKHCGPRSSWLPEHDALLKKSLADGYSYGEAAEAINAEFKSSYTRNACIGRGRRLGVGSQLPVTTKEYASMRERDARANIRKREKRWAAQPDLKVRYERLQEMKKNRLAFKARGAATTSAEYRKHVPRIRSDLTRSELRAMLTQAVQNTAAMEIAA
jgi:hypothetical protein